MQTLLAMCEARRDELVACASQLVGLESPTDNKPAVDACGRVIAERLRAIGARVRVVHQTVAGDHLVAEIGNGERPVMLLGHFDTVWPAGELVRQPCGVRDGWLYGPGVYDMKAGLASALLSLEWLSTRPGGIPGAIRCVFTSDEETGSATSRRLIETAARDCRAVLVLEPSLDGGALKTARKGCAQYTVSLAGTAAHAGVEPEKGASAIHELARQIPRWLAWQDPGRGLTMNVGVVRGGTRPNVVAEAAAAEVDVRAVRLADLERVDTALRTTRPADPRVSMTVDGGIDRPPLERTAGVVRLFELAREIAATLGQELGEGATGGGSDGNFTAASGVPTLDGLGVIGVGAHARGERVELASWPWRTALVAGLLDRLLAEEA